MYNFANKVVSNVWRNDFVGNNSRMSIDKLKPANSNTRRIVYATDPARGPGSSVVLNW